MNNYKSDEQSQSQDQDGLFGANNVSPMSAMFGGPYRAAAVQAAPVDPMSQIGVSMGMPMAKNQAPQGQTMMRQQVFATPINNLELGGPNTFSKDKAPQIQVLPS